MTLFTKSNSRTTKLLFLAFAGLGIVVYFCAKTLTIDPEKAMQVLWLGRLLIAFGAIGWPLVDAVSVWVDEKTKTLVIQKKNLFRTTSNVVPFAHVEQIRTLRMGRSKGPVVYQLVIDLKNSQQIKTGRWSLDQSEIVSEAESLALIVGSNAQSGLVVHPVNSNLTIGSFPVNQMALAFVISLAIYAIWYRCQVGIWCSAMWFGTAPIFIIGFSFIACLNILRRIPRQ